MPDPADPRPDVAPHGAPPAGAPGPARRPPGTLRVGSIAGTEVLVSSSWFLVAGLIAVMLAPRIELVEPGLGAWSYVAGVAIAVVLYLAVLLHEVSHAAMARHYGFPPMTITLHFLGGMTTIEGEARTPRQEFMIAVVGPLTSIGVGLVALVPFLVLPDGLLQFAVGAVAFSNLLIGVLNLVPGLPLDGGRVLKAAVWGATGSPHRATIVAAWGGRAAAVLVLCWPLAQEAATGDAPDLLDFLLAVVVAAFLWSGSTAALSSARLRRRLPALVARDLARRTLTVPGDLPLAEAVRRAQEVSAGGIVTVTSAGAPEGVVSEAALLATPEDRRPWLATSSVTRTLDPGLRLPVGIGGEELVVAITRRPAAEYVLVEEDGSVYGVLATADVDEAFRQTAG